MNQFSYALFALLAITGSIGDHVLAISLHNTPPYSSDLRITGITLVELVEHAKGNSRKNGVNR